MGPVPVVTSLLIDRLAGVIRRNHRHPLIRAGAGVAQWYLRSAFNEKYWNFTHNGELRLLQVLADSLPSASAPTVFDVGANVGDYALSVVAAIPQARVHCFEIVAATGDVLRRRLSTLPHCVVAGHGLSDRTGSIQIGSRRECDTGARVISPLLQEFANAISCDVTTGDHYLHAHGIARIDLLKIDTEGHDMSVLKGFPRAIRAGRIGVIQFEYGTTWIPYRFFLHDAYSLLSPAGYRLGRLYPEGVEFKQYDRVKDDHFRMGNYVAVHETQPDLLARLNIGRGVPLSSGRSDARSDTRG